MFCSLKYFLMPVSSCSFFCSVIVFPPSRIISSTMGGLWDLGRYGAHRSRPCRRLLLKNVLGNTFRNQKVLLR